ncbi:MAG: hypothetical protein KC917_07505 [Candidatus Omnitrophica bacterium]|nr:hypothetical protein [Candidatus Omnitrophota bacterium]
MIFSRCGLVIFLISLAMASAPYLAQESSSSTRGDFFLSQTDVWHSLSKDDRIDAPSILEILENWKLYSGGSILLDELVIGTSWGGVTGTIDGFEEPAAVGFSAGSFGRNYTITLKQVKDPNTDRLAPTIGVLKSPAKGNPVQKGEVPTFTVQIPINLEEVEKWTEDLDEVKVVYESRYTRGWLTVPTTIDPGRQVATGRVPLYDLYSNSDLLITVSIEGPYYAGYHQEEGFILVDADSPEGTNDLDPLLNAAEYERILILLHDILGSEEDWNHPEDFPKEFEEEYNYILYGQYQSLRREISPLSPYGKKSASARAARILWDHFLQESGNRNLASFTSAEIDLVGHGQGGVVGRWFLEEFPKDRVEAEMLVDNCRMIDRFLSLDAPHNGIDFNALRAAIVPNRVPSAAFDDIEVIGQEGLLGTNYLNRWVEVNYIPFQNLYSIAVDDDLIVPNESALYLEADQESSIDLGGGSPGETGHDRVHTEMGENGVGNTVAGWFGFQEPSSPNFFLVRKDGTGDFTTIQGALDAMDYNDGIPNVVVVGPGVYDQQLTPNGDAGVDSARYPNVFDMTQETVEQAFASHTDPLTIRGENPNDPPVITYLDGADRGQQPYGWFVSDPSVFVETNVYHCGNNVTYKNLEFRHGTLGYCMNGMSSGTVFVDCLFTNGMLSNQGHDDYWDFVNNVDFTSAVNPKIGANNEYFFENCIFDGRSTVDGSLFDSNATYFHGYDSIGTPETFLDLGGVTAKGCLFRNWEDTIFQIRGREEYDRSLDHLIIEDCFSHNVENLAILEGATRLGIVNRCVHDMSGRQSFIRLEERSWGLPANVIVANNIISGTSDRGSILRIHVNTHAGSVAYQHADWHIVNNTFYGHDSAAIITDGTPDPGNTVHVTIANNIIHGDGSEMAVGIQHEAGGGEFSLINNGFFGNAGGDFSGSGVTPEENIGTIYKDPEYYWGDPIPIIPVTTGAIPIQGFNPTSFEYFGGGSVAAYEEIRPWVGNWDVDQSDTRTSGNVDIGAQQDDLTDIFPFLDWGGF